jgi:transglutaminase-like putative cysteine protease
MKKYLALTSIIDGDHPLVRELAARLSNGCGSDLEIAKNCFEWVRDTIKHSHDYQLDPVTCKASEVLLHKTGYCYAKSHLLAALLRVNRIPAGLCYQRLSLEDNGAAPFCLHGLNAVYLNDYGWYRIDARGNKPGVDARFCPPVEQLAFPAVNAFEKDLPEIWPEPLSVVVDTLTRYKTFQEVYNNLPDIEVILSPSLRA